MHETIPRANNCNFLIFCNVMKTQPLPMASYVPLLADRGVGIVRKISMRPTTFRTLGQTAVLALCAVLTAAEREGPLGVPATWGLATLNGILAERQNVVLPIDRYELNGFERDLLSEYRTDSVLRRGGAGSSVAAPIDAEGEFYPAVLFYDSGGEERFAIVVDGIERGVVAADWDDNQQRLFFLTQPVPVKAGSRMEVRAETADGLYRIETLVLLKRRPLARSREYAIRGVEARPDGSGNASVSWISTWPNAGTVEWNGDGGAPGKSTEDLAVNNHRVLIKDLAAGRAYRFRVTGKTPEGREIATPWSHLKIEPPAAVAGAATRGRVTIQVADPLQSGGSGPAPVTSGVPFPKGALGSDGNLRLLDSEGREVFLQTRTLGRWDDGSVKWALLDFRASAAGAYTLEYGGEVRRAGGSSPLTVSEDGSKVEIRTGPLKLEVSRTRFGLPGTVWIDGNRNGQFETEEVVTSQQSPGVFELVDAGGVVYSSAAAPDEVVVEERGPQRATVRISGGHHAADGKRLFAYSVRIHAYAGEPFLRIQHTFANDSGAAEFTTIRSLKLRVPLAAAPGARGFDPKGQFTLGQHRDDRYTISRGGKVLTEKGRAPGKAVWSDGKRRVTLAVRDFWQNYPKDLAVSASGFELGVCPPLAKDEYADAKGTVDEHRLYYYLQNGGYKLRQGVSKTHDLWLGFGAGDPPLSPLRAVAAPEWYAASKAFGELAPRKSSGVLATYDEAFERSFAAYMENRETNREYGMLNFGDWWGERVINWGNSEYDTQHAFFLQFARTGDWRYYLAGEQMEWHNRDVDTVHHHTDRSRLGGVYLHCVGHTGDYYEESPVKGRGITRGGMSVSHTFIEGHLNYYFLTGDGRSFDAAKNIADRYDSYETRNYDFTNCRNPGWHLILTMAMYNASYDPYYLNAARIIVDRVLERQTPDGGWQRQMVPGHCTCMPRHHGAAGFMVAILLTGLKHYYEATGEERVADSIVKASHYLIDDMWLPEINGFRYTSCPRSFTGAWSNFLLFDGIVFAHQRTGDARLEMILKRGTGSALESMTGWGKGFTQYTRVAPHFIGYLAELNNH